MQHGDLEAWERQRIIVVIEGVLCTVSEIEQRKRLRRTKTVGYNIHWYDLALKRLAVMKRRWPAVGHEYVSFISEEFVDQAGEYLDAIGLAYDSVAYHPFSQFCSVMKFHSDIQAVYDSAPERLAHYGQRGVGVHLGQDF